MSHARVPLALVALVALVAVVSVMSCSNDDAARLDSVAPSVDTIGVNFSCTTVDSIALKTPNGKSAWSFRRNPNDAITWVVPSNVTIHSVAGKGPGDFPIDSNGVQGGSPGAPFKAKVKGNAANGTYHYLINATCTPASGPAVDLVIDPEMIVPR